ncbi:acyltransferase family protein [Clostridium akagii]|uniref:acyltransferase family protein n=1 Tax=Clostridium akagii TaxID=91623 RepID=UPI00047CC502|nr:acyltransferase family protein [Clostridium akagii]
MKEIKRNYLFDNLKVLLIFLVVVGHSLENYIDNNMVLRGMYFFIFMFHMPLFIYVSGYFSKNVEKCRKNAIKDLLIPFIFFNIIWYISVGNFKFPIYYAGWTLWYLLSLFIWRFFLIDIIKVKWLLGLSIILGLFVGFDDKYVYLLSFTRTFAFLPFFLFGYYSNNITIKKIKSYPKIISVLGLISIGSFAFLITKYSVVNYRFLYMSESYKSFGLGVVQGMLLRALFYILAIIVSIFIINLVSNRKFNLSKIGANTMIIYLGHIYAIRFIDTWVPTLNSLTGNLLIIVIFSIIICAILSLPIFYKIYNYVFTKINYCRHVIFVKLKLQYFNL